MFDKHQILHQHGGSIMVIIPADVVRHFQLEKGKRLKMSYEHERLVIDLRPADSAARPKILAGATA
jgi:antitoxin component of MazEF toxin-antitoxin module